MIRVFGHGLPRSFRTEKIQEHLAVLLKRSQVLDR
jgi:hypothetical protein